MTNQIIKPAIDALNKADTLLENINKHIDIFNAKYHIADPMLPPRQQYISDQQQSPTGIYYNDIPLYEGKELIIPGYNNGNVIVISRSNVLNFMGIRGKG